MLLFRSEEHVDRWVEAGHPRGEIFTLDQLWDLARKWYTGRLDPNWTSKSPEEANGVFADCGLTGPFWRLDT